MLLTKEGRKKNSVFVGSKEQKAADIPISELIIQPLNPHQGGITVYRHQTPSSIFIKSLSHCVSLHQSARKNIRGTVCPGVGAAQVGRDVALIGSPAATVNFTVSTIKCNLFLHFLLCLFPISSAQYVKHFRPYL